jgi:hypothetical protein
MTSGKSGTVLTDPRYCPWQAETIVVLSRLSLCLSSSRRMMTASAAVTLAEAPMRGDVSIRG